MIEARAITKRFGSFEAVRDVSLEVGGGEFLTLLGPSGCGKTTLLRVLAGFESPDAGAVLLDGVDVTRLPPYRRSLNQVFQSYALFPHLTVRDNIAFGLRMKGVPPPERAERVAGAVAAASLEGLEERRPHQLSGGQRQRVALARALVCRPRVLLLDEPLSALDAKLRRGMQLELKRLQRRLGITFIFVTHDQQEALTMSDRIAIMNAGRIEQVGAPDDIYRRPRTAFAADFIGQANLLSLALVSREGGFARLRATDGLEFTLPGPAVGDGRTEVLVSIRPERVILARDEPDLPNRFPARVEERIFQGASDRVTVVLESGTRLHALLAGENAAGPALREGDRVFCAVREDDLVVVG